MVFRIRTTACTILLILLSVSTMTVFASNIPLRVVVKPTSLLVQAIRYQTGTKSEGPWIEMDASSPIVVLESFDNSQDKLFVQESEDLQNWSTCYEYRYNPSANVWAFAPSEAKKTSMVDSLDLKLYGLYPVGECSTYYAYVLGAGLKMNVALDKQKALTGYGEVAYSSGPSKTDWVDVMQAVNLSIGIGYRFDPTEKLQITPELGYGLILHLLQADFDQDGTKTFEAFIDQQVRLSLNLSYALNDTYRLIVAPLGVLFFEKDSIAALLGFQAGLRFNF